MQIFDPHNDQHKKAADKVNLKCLIIIHYLIQI